MVYLGTRQKGKRPQMIFDSSKGKRLDKGFTLILCFSRMWCFNKFFLSFEKMKIDMKNCHLLIMDNSADKALRDALYGRAKEYANHFKSVRLYKSWRLYQRPLLTKRVIKWKDSPNGPILGMHLDAMRLCKTDRFVMIEDDTLCPPDAVTRVLSLLDDNPKCGFATGLQAMRQSAAYMLTYPAAYYVTIKDGRITETVSLSPNLRGVHKIDGSGWYCFASYRRLFSREIRFLLKADDETRNYAVDILGVNHIRSLGYDVLADFGLWCGHYTKLQGSDFIWTRKQCRPMITRWCPEWHCYLRTISPNNPASDKILRRLTRTRDRN